MLPISSDRHTKQLQHAIAVIRQDVVTSLDQARGARSSLVERQEPARCEKAKAIAALADAVETRIVAAAIEDRAQMAKIAAARLAASAAASSDAAALVTAAMTTASASIKGAVAAVEDLTRESSGVATVAHNEDQQDQVDRDSKAAAAALTSTLGSINDELKQVCLASNVIAAQSQALSAVLSFDLCRTQLDQICATAEAQLSAAGDMVQKAVAERNNSYASTEVAALGAATAQVEALEFAVKELDGKFEQATPAKIVPAAQSTDLSPEREVLRQLQEQTAAAALEESSAVAATAALGVRLTAGQASYVEAKQSAQAAASHLSDGRLATQTLLAIMTKGQLAHTQAASIRKQLGMLAQQAYQTALAISGATEAVVTLAADVQSPAAQHGLVSPILHEGSVQANRDAPKACAAALSAVQDCGRAFAAACVAEKLAGDPVRLGEDLLALLLEEEAKEKGYYKTIQNVAALQLCSSELRTMQQIAATVGEAGAGRGLLNLLTAVKTVTQLAESAAGKTLDTLTLEDNAAQGEADRAHEKRVLLEAALSAASAAVM